MILKPILICFHKSTLPDIYRSIQTRLHGTFTVFDSFSKPLSMKSVSSLFVGVGGGSGACGRCFGKSLMRTISLLCENGLSSARKKFSHSCICTLSIQPLSSSFDSVSLSMGISLSKYDDFSWFGPGDSDSRSCTHNHKMQYTKQFDVTAFMLKNIITRCFSLSNTMFFHQNDMQFKLYLTVTLDVWCFMYRYLCRNKLSHVILHVLRSKSRFCRPKCNLYMWLPSPWLELVHMWYGLALIKEINTFN